MSDTQNEKPAESAVLAAPVADGEMAPKPAEIAPIFVVRRQEILLDQVVFDQTLRFVRDDRGRLVSDLATVAPERRDDVLNVLAGFPADFLFVDAAGKEIVTPKVAEPEVAGESAADAVPPPPPRQDPKYLPGRVPGASRRRRGR